MAEINQDSEDIESTEGFRHGILTALCFVTPVVVVVLSVVLFFVEKS